MLILVEDPTVTVTLGGEDASLRLLFRQSVSLPPLISWTELVTLTPPSSLLPLHPVGAPCGLRFGLLLVAEMTRGGDCKGGTWDQRNSCMVVFPTLLVYGLK